jgi:hypothetical protein
LVTLQEFGVYVKTMGLPFLIAGDWNMTASELAPLGMENFLGARWAVPKGEAPGELREIDMVLGTDHIVATAELQWDLHGPWTPHTGIIINFSAEILQHETRMLRTPVELEVAAGPDLPWSSHQEYSKEIRAEGHQQLARHRAEGGRRVPSLYSGGRAPPRQPPH